MEIAHSNPLSIRLSFDPTSLLRQIVEVLVRGFWGARGPDHLRMAQAPSLAAYEPPLVRVAPPSRVYPGRRQGAYAPRWG